MRYLRRSLFTRKWTESDEILSITILLVSVSRDGFGTSKRNVDEKNYNYQHNGHPGLLIGVS